MERDPSTWDRVDMQDDELWQIAHDYARAEAEASELRPRLYAGLYEYKQANINDRGWQTKLVEKTGLTRERIRQIIAAEEKRRAVTET